MSEAAVYWATFSAREGWAECDGVRYEGYRCGWIIKPLCELLVAAGHPDGVLNFRDAVSGQRHFWIASIHRAAATEHKTREEHFEEVRAAALLRAAKRAESEPVAAPKPVRQPTVPIEDRILFVTVGDETVRVTPKQREAFAVVTQSPKTWETLHAKTRNWLVSVKWVAVSDGIPRFTDIGRLIDQAVTVAVNEAA